MLRYLSAVAAALLLIAVAVNAQSSIQIDESNIRAVLRNSSTCIVVPILNSTDRLIRAHLSLAWINEDETVANQASRALSIPPGSSMNEVPLPLVKATVWTRLRYSLSPDESDAKSFAPISGVAALSHISDYTFDLKLNSAGNLKSRSRISIFGQALHPVNLTPVQDIEWNAQISVNGKDLSPLDTKSHKEGFVEFIFNLPQIEFAKNGTARTKGVVTARKGDFKQENAVDLWAYGRPSGRIQSDKPIYQPGQTMHLRAVVLDEQGKALPKANVILTIKNSEEEVHKASLVSSNFGIAQDEWTIPEAARSDRYQILLGMGDSYNIFVAHEIQVSRYELPAFKVTIETDRTAYLPKELPKIKVVGEYLFGKPVPKGHVKIVHRYGWKWDPQYRSYDIGYFEKILAEGNADENGEFVARPELKFEQEERQSEYDRFRDIRLTAYYTDPSSGRTELGRFDVRLTRETLHVYIIRAAFMPAINSPVYISTSYPDGRPASARVELRYLGQVTTLQTNRYGIGKTFFDKVSIKDIESGFDLEARATDSSGKSGSVRERFRSNPPTLRLETSHTIFRAGEPAAIKVISPPSFPPDQAVVIHATAEDRRIASQTVRIINHIGETVFPYQPEFQGRIIFGAWNPEFSDSNSVNSKTVIFPFGSDLKVSAKMDRVSYKPGEKASLQIQVVSPDGKPMKAAAGVAVVDESVLERAAGRDIDAASWFSCLYCHSNDKHIGGVRLENIYGLKPASEIEPELDLAAEALVLDSRISMWNEERKNTQFKMFTSMNLKVSADLNKNYLDSLEFPHNENSLDEILGLTLRREKDPWGMSYFAEFDISYAYYNLKIMSSGPDKTKGTEDDLEVGSWQRNYFAPVRFLIQEALKKQDYPATYPEFTKLLADNGLLFESLKDPWGTAYIAIVQTQGQMRNIKIKSAGPDRQFETFDDIEVDDFSGPYFQKEEKEIAAALQHSSSSPQTTDEFKKVLKDAGIDFNGYRDAWDRPYFIESEIRSSYADQAVNAKSITLRYITFYIVSRGLDGQISLHDLPDDNGEDFEVAHFDVLLKEERSQFESIAGANAVVPLVGIIMDRNGAVIPDCSIILMGSTGPSYKTITDSKGAFQFASIPPGVYSMKAFKQGFAAHVIEGLEIVDGKSKDIVIELAAGEKTDVVEVNIKAEDRPMATMPANRKDLMATPRVREYFPETLLWIPELIMDAKGNARVQFPLADTVTKWKVAAVASTLDGRIAEAETDFRTFQPFFLDFNPPPILTEGDRLDLPVTIRNYQDQAEKVDVNYKQNECFSVQGALAKRIVVPANQSTNVAYPIEAGKATDKAAQQIIANAGKKSDAIEKSSRIHPDGQEITHTVGDFVSQPASLHIAIPAAAIRGATRGQLRIYPNISSLLLESAEALLSAPHGCAEQIASAGYANLVAWRFIHSAGFQDKAAEDHALKNVRLAIDGLKAFGGGGIGYWNSGNPDIAATAHALSFLLEAADLFPEKDRIGWMISWLESQQSNGLWRNLNTLTANSDRQELLLTSTVARALAAAKKSGFQVKSGILGGAYYHMAKLTNSIEEPYMLANFILAALDSGNDALLSDAAKRLAAMGREEQGGAYWDLQTNSPFYGWGTAGRYETTGLAISALSKWRAAHPEAKELDAQIRRGLVFLIRGRDKAGSWQSTQSTLRAMRAIVDAETALGGLGRYGGTMAIHSNGKLVKEVILDSSAQDPITVDLNPYLSHGDNQIALTPAAGMQSAIVLLTSTYWLPWEQTKTRTSPELRLNCNLID